ncbi:MAG: VWA domain-containing protein [Acidobacteriota bacterium]
MLRLKRSFQVSAPHRRDATVAGLVALALLTLLAPAMLGAQDEPAPIFDEVVEVNVVNIEVVVVDAEGRPVRDLEADDFEIFEDGRAMEVSNFYEIRDGQNVVAPAPDAPISGDVQDASAEADPKPVIDLESRAFVIFFDNTSLEKKNRRRVLQASRDFVQEHMGPKDFVKVSMLESSGELRTVTGFTNSPGDVVYAIDQIESTQVDGNVVNNNVRQLVRDIVLTQTGAERAGGGPGDFTASLDVARVKFNANMLRGRINAEVRRTYHRSEQSLAALEYLMRPLAGIPGQKAVVYFGEGLPTKPGETLFHAFSNKFSNIAELYDEIRIDPPEVAALEFDLSKRFEYAVARAQEAGVRFYAIDASGRRGSFRGSAEYGLTDSNSLAGSGYQDTWNQRLDTLRERNLRGGLELIATETGAATLAETRDYGGFFDRIDRDLNNFYSLGYQPPRERDGQFHDIEVRTKNPDYRLTYRRNYLNKTSEQALVDLALAELLTDASTNPLSLWLEPGRPQPSQDEKYVVPVSVKFPIEKATLLPQGDGRQVGQLMAVVVVKDEIGDTSPPQRIPLTIELNNADIEAGKVPVAVAAFRLVMREGKQTLAVAVRDRLSGITASDSVVVAVDPNRRRGR